MIAKKNGKLGAPFSRTELAWAGAGNLRRKTLSMLDLHNSELNWVSLANGRATSNAEFAAQFESAMRERGPRLIEVTL